MRKIIILLMIACLALSLPACSLISKTPGSGFQENTQQNVDEDAADTDDGEDDNEDAATSGNNADTDTEEVTGNDGGAQDIPSVQTDDAGNIHIEDGDSEYNWGTLSDSDIPDDYPADALPLFGLDSAALLGSNRQDMGDAGIIFIIVFGVDDDVSAVSSNIGGQLEQFVNSHGGEFATVMDMLFMGEVNGCEYAVTIADGSSEGYKTAVSYTVTLTD